MTFLNTHDDLPTLNRDGDVFVLSLGSGENRFNPGWLDSIDAHLDAIEAAEGPRALVTTATGKIWSNGLDLQWLMANADQIPAFSARVEALFARVLALGLPTVAALQGHAFGAGAMLALAHDQRVMRADRGYFCFPEVDIQIPFSVGMSELIAAKLPVRTAHDAMTTGRRYGGAEATAEGIADEAVDEQAVLSAAMDRARGLASKAGATLATIKQRRFRTALGELRTPA
ncbi:Enoyl-CoA hydratase/carnithine racemase [Rhodococcus maanshanensis]|uniref:Enoyl-CoA hydratase/carnithine racemase n=1 Tax=Rhodococcus maanshanensis TaxID=183556 RepID=A0A1H7HTI4_9NOCA|nr:enoyl-CoA hydratase-related protein [Rhodococcus maanshanensis]SEK53504.1 Enoyl-CoA hydratase/carnithine racemase [Rhodococcus maanshanensis]